MVPMSARIGPDGVLSLFARDFKDVQVSPSRDQRHAVAASLQSECEHARSVLVRIPTQRRRPGRSRFFLTPTAAIRSAWPLIVSGRCSSLLRGRALV